MIKFYPLARKIHRFLVLIVIILGLVMMITGTLMKFPEIVSFPLPT